MTQNSRSKLTMDNTSSENIQQNYWLGPYDIRVPNHVTRVTDSDGGNTLFKTGGNKVFGRTEMDIPNKPTEAEYKERYCILVDGHYYWNGV